MKARKTNSKDARIPRPNADLFDAMARAGFEAWTYNPIHDMHGSWSALKQSEQDQWVNVAKEMYGVMVQAGGGKLEAIE